MKRTGEREREEMRRGMEKGARATTEEKTGREKKNIKIFCYVIIR